jgi:hypothetical protein
MFGRASAWPLQWRDVLPLLALLVFVVWAVASELEVRIRRSKAPLEPGAIDSVLVFLVIWCICEAYLVANLPLRSAHYYVIACVPVYLLSGWPVAVLARRLKAFSGATRLAAWSAAAVLTLVFCRHSVDEIVPRAVAAVRSYDWGAERVRFESEIHRGPIHYGRGEPFNGRIEEADPSSTGAGGGLPWEDGSPEGRDAWPHPPGGDREQR